MKVRITEDGKAYFNDLKRQGFTHIGPYKWREWHILSDLEYANAPMTLERLFRSDTSTSEILNTLPGHDKVYVQVLRDLAQRGLVEIAETKKEDDSGN